LQFFEFSPEGSGLVACLVGAGVTWMVSWFLQPFAPRLNLLDFPKGRKDHAHPTPIVGGIAMLCGLLAASLVVLPTLLPAFRAFLAGGVLLAVVGLFDDRYDLRWYWRIGAQVVAALLMVYVGGVRVEQLGDAFGLGHVDLGALSVPFTVFATVGLINAINMVDGSDGLAGTLVLTALALITAAALYSGNLVIANAALVLVGVVAAFLWFNVRFPWRERAKIFMGNAGSALLGYAIAWLAFRLTQSPSHPVSPVLALWCVAVPVADCLVLIVRRWRAGVSPFAAAHDHVHYLMREAGYGPSRIAATLAMFTVGCTAVVAQAMRWDVPNPVMLGAFGLLCVWWFWLTRRRARAVAFFRAVYPQWLFRRPLMRDRRARARPLMGHPVPRRARAITPSPVPVVQDEIGRQDAG
jgi:UDP-GlcNAc:undecaprenyl-phosphate/decaprenyl-phosphate GlcNAc-1-phosphate transferase